MTARVHTASESAANGVCGKYIKVQFHLPTSFDVELSLIILLRESKSSSSAVSELAMNLIGQLSLWSQINNPRILELKCQPQCSRQLMLSSVLIISVLTT